jgi:glycosyltransferase involved in cell wall biosynthesis
MDLPAYGWLATWVFRAGAPLSRFADAIIVNSFAGKAHHVAEGYFAKGMIVIPNGIDSQRFRPDPAAGRRMRQEWKVATSERLIGLVGRLDPMKDHVTFLRAAELLARERSDVRFVCVGAGPEPYRTKLQSLSAELSLGARLIWAGPYQDVRAVYSALDIATSSSANGEGFSNVIAEAMACGVPCVATAVGDSALIVNEPQCIVPPRTPPALAAAWSHLLDCPRERRMEIGHQARRRIEREYSLERLVDRTEAVLLGVVKRPRPIPAP